MEDSEEEVSTGEVSAVASTAAVLVLPLRLPDTLEAELAVAVGESGLAERASQVAFQTLPAQAPGFLHLEDHHPGNLCMMDDLIEP